jgi:hypothetical protein
MLRRIWVVLVLAVLAGCSEGADPTGVPPQSQAEAERKQAADEGEGVGVDKCSIYRRPPFCPVP